MRASQLVAVLAFLLAVPGCIGLAYAGSRGGLYPHDAIPVVFGVLFTSVIIGLFVLLPPLKSRLG